MKSLNTFCLCLSLGSGLLLSQCSTASSGSSRKALSNYQEERGTGRGTVTMQRMDDTTVKTQTLIHHQLTNADSGKVYQIVTIKSPRGTSVQERVIVQAQPYLELRNVTR